MIIRKDFEERFKPRFRNPVSTGWELIDDICKGGLGQKELGVVIAPLVPASLWLWCI